MKEIIMSEEEKERLHERVMQRIKETQTGCRDKKTRRQLAVAAAVAGLVLLSAGGYAAAKLPAYHAGNMQKDGYRASVELAKETDDANDAPIWVKLDCELPEGYRLQKEGEDGDGWYDLCWKDGYDAGKEVSFTLIRADAQEEKTLMSWIGVERAQDALVGEHRAMYLEYTWIEGSIYSEEKESQCDYDKRLVVFYEEQGYIVQYYAMKGVGKAELLELAEGIALRACKEEEADKYLPLRKEIPAVPAEGTADAGPDAQYIDADKVRAIGETGTYDGIDYTVKDVQVLDSLAGLKEECFNDSMGIMERKDEFLADDGRFVSYLREKIAYGDGHLEPFEKVVDTKEVSLRFVKVELEVKNYNKSAVEYQACKGLACLMKDGDFYQRESNHFNRPGVIEDCMMDTYAKYYEETKGGKGFYLDTLQAGESKTCTIGYFVDEDLLDSTYIELGGESTADMQECEYLSIK